jgi:hypothetical protein
MGSYLTRLTEQEKQLLDADPNVVRRFSFKGIKARARVCKVYDGDTCTVLFLYAGEIVKARF